MKTKYLIQKGSGHIYVHTPALAERDDMREYEGEFPAAVKPSEDDGVGGAGGDGSGVEGLGGEDNPVTLPGEAPEKARPVSQMSKDELAQFAAFNFGVTLDTEKPLAELRRQVSDLTKGVKA